MTIQKNELDSPLEMTSLQIHPLKQKVPAGGQGIFLSLLTKSEGFDNRTIKIDIVRVEVLQQLAALTYQHGQ